MNIRSGSTVFSVPPVDCRRAWSATAASVLVMSSLLCGGGVLAMSPDRAAQSAEGGFNRLSSAGMPVSAGAMRMALRAGGASASLSHPRVALREGGLSAQALQQLYDEAERHYRRGEDVEALRIFSSLIELAPQHRDSAWLRVGNIHQRAGSVGAALDAYRNLLAGEPERSGITGGTTADARRTGRGSGIDGRRGAAKESTGRGSGPDVQQRALRLKGMVNLLTLSVAQTQASLDHIALLQQDPAVRAAAGLTEQAEAALVDSVLAQVGRIQQMLGGVPAGAPAMDTGLPGAVITAADSHAKEASHPAAGGPQDRGATDVDRRHRGRQGARDGYRPRPSPPSMLIGYPVDVLAAPAVDVRASQGVSVRPVIEYLDEAPVAGTPRRGPE